MVGEHCSWHLHQVGLLRCSSAIQTLSEALIIGESWVAVHALAGSQIKIRSWAAASDAIESIVIWCCGWAVLCSSFSQVVVDLLPVWGHITIIDEVWSRIAGDAVVVTEIDGRWRYALMCGSIVGGWRIAGHTGGIASYEVRSGSRAGDAALSIPEGSAGWARNVRCISCHWSCGSGSYQVVEWCRVCCIGILGWWDNWLALMSCGIEDLTLWAWAAQFGVQIEVGSRICAVNASCSIPEWSSVGAWNCWVWWLS